MRQPLAAAIHHWAYVAPIVKYPQNQKDFQKIVSWLDALLDMVGEDESHPLIGMVDVLSHLIDLYERDHFPHLAGKGVEALKFLMKAHHLRQSDLSEIASQGVLSEILHGKRVLNIRQIKLLAKRFGVDPTTFMDN